MFILLLSLFLYMLEFLHSNVLKSFLFLPLWYYFFCQGWSRRSNRILIFWISSFKAPTRSFKCKSCMWWFGDKELWWRDQTECNDNSIEILKYSYLKSKNVLLGVPKKSKVCEKAKDKLNIILKYWWDWKWYLGPSGWQTVLNSFSTVPSYFLPFSSFCITFFAYC